MDKTIGDHLLALKARSGLSLSEIARLAGYRGASSLQRYFSPTYDPEALDYRTAQKIAEAMEGAGDPPIDQYEIMVLTAAVDSTGVRPPLAPVQPSKEMKSFIPVFDTTSVSSREFSIIGKRPVEVLHLDMSEAVEVLRCPPVLERRDVSAFYMSGTAMRPRFNPGQIVFTEGRKPPAIGDDVLVLLTENDGQGADQRGVIGLLQDIGPEHLSLKHHASGSFEVPLARVGRVRRVMEAAELLSGFII